MGVRPVGDIKVLTTDRQKRINAAKELLVDALAGEFDTIVILGIKDEKWEVFNSSHVNGFTLLGMLEAIKLESFRLWEGDNV